MEDLSVVPRQAVRVTVTTVCFDGPDGEISYIKAGQADGVLPRALADALSQRVYRRTLHKVYGRVLADRPGRGECVEYEASFKPTRLLRILVQPVGSNGSTGAGKLRRVQLTGLTMPTEPPGPAAVAITA